MKSPLIALAVFTLLSCTFNPASAQSQEAPLKLGRLGDLVIPKVTFSGASLAEAVAFLEVKTKELDPQKTGQAFLVDDATRALPVRLTIELSNTTLADTLRYLALMARLEISVVEDAVQLRHSASVHPPFPAIKASPRVMTRAAVLFPQVQFSGATLDEVVEFVRIKGLQFDPAGGGVAIIIDPELAGQGKATITLNLANVPLSKVLTYSAALANAEVVCLGNAIYVQPRKQEPSK